MKQTYSTAEVAEMVGVTPMTIRRWARRGLVTPSYDARGHSRYTRTDIDSMAPAPSAQRPAADKQSRVQESP